MSVSSISRALNGAHPEPWERLFLRCESGRKEFFTCEIYETHKEMLQAIERDDDWNRSDPRTQAAILTYRAYDAKGKITPEYGTIYFCRPKLTPGNIVHEFTHAAIRWAKRRHINPMGSNSRGNRQASAEERTCHMLGYLNYQFYAHQKKRIYFICGEDITHRDLAECKLRNNRSRGYSRLFGSPSERRQKEKDCLLGTMNSQGEFPRVTGAPSIGQRQDNAGCAHAS